MCALRLEYYSNREGEPTDIRIAPDGKGTFIPDGNSFIWAEVNTRRLLFGIGPEVVTLWAYKIGTSIQETIGPVLKKNAHEKCVIAFEDRLPNGKPTRVIARYVE